ncbi:MAG: class I SAM-dependent methyltransferase [Pseudomonadota bacterium]
MTTAIDTHVAGLLRLTPIADCTVIDVGCGLGGLVRALAAKGATVTGVEISAEKVADADAHAKVANERYIVGTGERLPADDGSADLITYVFSLHHVPVDLQAAALAEAHRVLRPGGRLHVVDPLPEGPATEVMRPIEDEGEVRRATHARMDRLDGKDWTLVEKSTYTIDRPYADLDEYLKSVVLVDPSRAERLPETRNLLAGLFADRTEKRDGRYWLSQPCVMYHLTQASHD